MLRNGLEDVSSANVILDVKPGGEVEFMARATDGGETAYLAGAFVAMPAWLRLEWTPVNGGTVTGYVSQDSVTWSPVGTVTYPTALVGDVGIAVTSHDLQQLTRSHLEGLSVVPLGWLNTDVGNTGLTGNTADVAGGGLSFRVAGAGADIWGAADAFQYVFQMTASVTAVIQARILSEDATDPFAKVGVMIRNGNTPDAPFVILDMKPNGELEFMQRSIAGGDVT
jgi:hypothetical protein